jgi:hypothetical protein
MHAASHRLDGPVSNILNETPANRASVCSVAPTTTLCKTETSTITQTVTVTALSSSVSAFSNFAGQLTD